MIDIFVKERDNNNVSVYFVQLGCIYNSIYSNLETLCDNVVSLYTESNLKENGDIDFQFLPVNTYYKLYKKDTVLLFEKSLDVNTSYTVKKVC